MTTKPMKMTTNPTPLVRFEGVLNDLGVAYHKLTLQDGGVRIAFDITSSFQLSGSVFCFNPVGELEGVR